MKERNNNLDELKGQLEVIGKQIEAMAKEARDGMGDNLTDKLSATSQELKAQLDEKAVMAKEKSKEVKEYLEMHPWQTAGIAAAVGFLAAVIMTSRRDK